MRLQRFSILRIQEFSGQSIAGEWVPSFGDDIKKIVKKNAFLWNVSNYLMGVAKKFLESNIEK